MCHIGSRINGVVAPVAPRQVVKGGRCQGPVGGVGAARRHRTSSVRARAPGQGAEAAAWFRFVLPTNEL